jgi:hypothetical protein
MAGERTIVVSTTHHRRNHPLSTRKLLQHVPPVIQGHVMHGRIIRVSISTVTLSPAMRMIQMQPMTTHGSMLVQANTRIINLPRVLSRVLHIHGRIQIHFPAHTSNERPVVSLLIHHQDQARLVVAMKIRVEGHDRKERKRTRTWLQQRVL